MKKTLYTLAITAVVMIVAFLLIFESYRSVPQSTAEKPGTHKAAASRPALDSAVLVRPDSPALGPLMAKVVVVEFLDPECEGCQAMHPLVKRIVSEYEGRIRLVIRYMPLHGNSVYAATALEAAGAQGRFWDMLDILFRHQREWGDHRTPKPELIPQFAARIGLDMKAFQRSLDDPAHKIKIARDLSDGKAVGVAGTPTFFVNGRLLEQLGYDSLKALIDQELSRQ